MENTTNSQDTLLTINDVSKILNIGKSTAYSLVQKREIPTVKISNAIRVKKSDINEYINKQTIGANNE